MSVRSPDQVGPVGTPLVLDDPGIGGPLAGLSAALNYARQTGATRLLTLPCDMPGLPDDLARRLDEALVPGVGAAVAVCAGRLHPVCAVWDVAARDDLPVYLACRRSSVRGFAETVGMTTVVWDAGAAPAFENINTPIDPLHPAVRSVLGHGRQRRLRSDQTIMARLSRPSKLT